MWNKLNDYCLQNGIHTIAKVKIGDETTFNLYYHGKQYPGFKTLQSAMDEFDALELEKRMDTIGQNSNEGLHYE